VKILIIVNESPWGATLPVAALRLARAMAVDGHEIDAVFFRGDGVYNACRGRGVDAGTPDLAREWA
jgi:sulfur relay (sulfurtransferase) complex TusBCD TusD component (DsrE family)